jgi:hypothetical protein
VSDLLPGLYRLKVPSHLPFDPRDDAAELVDALEAVGVLKLEEPESPLVKISCVWPGGGQACCRLDILVEERGDQAMNATPQAVQAAAGYATA